MNGRTGRRKNAGDAKGVIASSFLLIRAKLRMDFVTIKSAHLKRRYQMRWTFHELGLMAPLSWYEWSLMACVLFLLVVAGWTVIQTFKILWKL